MCALRTSLVRYDGRSLQYTTQLNGADPAWLPLTEDGRPLDVVDLAVCADLNGSHQQLFVATAGEGIFSWTWQPDVSGRPRWVPWPPIPVQGVVRALTCWSAGAGQQQLVVAGEDGSLIGLKRADWREWSAPSSIDRLPGVRSLEVVTGADGEVELFALTSSELKRKKLPAAAAGSDGWGGAELVMVWPQQVSAQACWAVGDGHRQAVLLSSGDLLLREHVDGSWREWTTGVGPENSELVTSVSGVAPDENHQLLAATAVDGSVVVLGPGSGRDPRLWRRVHGGAGDTRGQTAATDVTVALASPDPSPPPEAPDHRASPEQSEQQEPGTRLFTGRDMLPLAGGEDRIGPFHLVKRIGGGQQGTDKYLARDGRGYCFLKALRPEATADEVTAFHRETTIAQRVTNRHRLTTYVDHAPARGDAPAFLALSFVAGQDLHEQLDTRRLEGADLENLARQLLQAVAELADCRVIHCDIKPANIIMRDATVPILVDFGSAVEADTTTVLEAAFGTNGYAAPEFLRIGATNRHTDIYSWAAVVVWAATGQTPSTDPDVSAQQYQRLPFPLREVVAAALGSDPTARPDVTRALARLGGTTPVPDLGVIQRLDVDADTRGLRLRVSSRRRELATAAAALSQWQYRGFLGIMAVAGIVLGFVAGVILRQVLEALL